MERLLNIANHNAVRANVLSSYDDTNIVYVAHVFSLWQTASFVSRNSKYSLDSICALCEYTISDNVENNDNHVIRNASNAENNEADKCCSEKIINMINNTRCKSKYSFGNGFIKRSAKCDELITLLSISLLGTLHAFRHRHNATLHKTHEESIIIELLNAQMTKLREMSIYTTFINELTKIFAALRTKCAEDARNFLYGNSNRKNIISQELVVQDRLKQQSEILPSIATYPVVNNPEQEEQMHEELPSLELFPECSSSSSSLSSETSLYISSTYISSSEEQLQEEEEEWEEEHQEEEKSNEYQEEEEQEMEDDLRNEIVLYTLSYCNHLVGFVELFEELFATSNDVNQTHSKEELWQSEQQEEEEELIEHCECFHVEALSPEREQWCYSIEKVATTLLEKLSCNYKRCWYTFTCDVISCSNDSIQSFNSDTEESHDNDIINKPLPPELYALVLLYSMLWCRVKCMLSVIKMYNAAEALQFASYTQLSFTMHQLLRQTHLFQKWQQSLKMIDEVAHHDECDAFASDASRLLSSKIAMLSRECDLPQNAETDFSNSTVTEQKLQYYQAKQNETRVECERQELERTKHALLRQQMKSSCMTCQDVTTESLEKEHYNDALIKRSNECHLCEDIDNNHHKNEKYRRKQEKKEGLLQMSSCERECSLQRIMQVNANTIFSLVLPTCCPYLWYLQYLFAILHARYALQFSACLTLLPPSQESNDIVLNSNHNCESKNDVHNNGSSVVSSNNNDNSNILMSQYDMSANDTDGADDEKGKEQELISHTKSVYEREKEEEKHMEESEKEENKLSESVLLEQPYGSEENEWAQTTEPFHLVYLLNKNKMSKQINNKLTYEQEEVNNSACKINNKECSERVAFAVDVRTFLENSINAVLETFHYPSTLLVVANYTQWHGKAAWHNNRYTLNMNCEPMYLFESMNKQSIFAENIMSDMDRHANNQYDEYNVTTIKENEHNGKFNWPGNDDSAEEYDDENGMEATLHTGIAPWVLNLVMPFSRLSNDKEVRYKQEELLIRVIAFNLAGDAFNDADERKENIDRNEWNSSYSSVSNSKNESREFYSSSNALHRNHVNTSICYENTNDKMNYAKSKCNEKRNVNNEHIISFLHHNSMFYAVKSRAKCVDNKTYKHKDNNNVNRNSINNNGCSEMYFIVHIHVPFNKFDKNENVLNSLLKRQEAQALRVLQYIRALWYAPWLPSYAHDLLAELHHMKEPYENRHQHD